MPSGEVFVFGPYQLDARARRLTRNGESIAITGRHFELLHLLVASAGHVLSKDSLIEAAWPDVAVADNSLEQTISSLRRLLTPPSGQPYIETQARRGYRFAADVTKLERRETDEALEALLAPHRAWIDGRAALETLERDEIVRARAVFEDVLRQMSGQASAHVGLSNACALQFEMTRSELPDVASIEQALHHAVEACRLDSQYGEAWATLGFVLDRVGRHDEALAASRRAVALEPDNWRHHVRLAYASWGEERLRQAIRTLTLLPGFPLAHWLAVSVHVARQAPREAERELRDGISAQEQASAAFDRELSHEDGNHLYARECCANTWYAIGAQEWWSGERDRARAGFERALRRVPLHPMARVGLAAVQGDAKRFAADADMGLGSPVDRALVRAASHVLSGTATGRLEAPGLVEQALVEAPPGSAGWLLSLEPLLRVSAEPDRWASALARLRNRAA